MNDPPHRRQHSHPRHAADLCVKVPCVKYSPFNPNCAQVRHLPAAPPSPLNRPLSAGLSAALIRWEGSCEAAQTPRWEEQFVGALPPNKVPLWWSDGPFHSTGVYTCFSCGIKHRNKAAQRARRRGGNRHTSLSGHTLLSLELSDLSKVKVWAWFWIQTYDNWEFFRLNCEV